MIIDGEIDQQVYSYLLPRRSRPARFYILLKIHKNKQNPPGRPIVSANSHPTENISQFVDSHLNPLVPKLPSYIKDTTHFLKKLDDLKELPPGSLLVTLDVSSLYTNIPHNEGIKACRKALNSSDHLSRSHLKTESICDLMRMILTMNNFEFDNNYYIQLHGTAMGTRMAPAYANLFMGDLERKLLAQSPLKPFIWWRYIDDIFMVWTHGEEKLNEFITHINSSHNTIKFTHQFSESSISFLDVTVLLDNNNQISTDLYVKSTDTHQYLLHTSCHPNHVKKSIPFSLALRIRRICSTAEKFKQRTSELLEFLCKRGHKRQYVQAQINKAFQIPRRDTLYYHSKKNTDRPVFVTTYNPSLPQLNSIIRKYFPILTATKRGSEAFKDAPLIAYRRPKNLRDFLVKAKLKQPSQSNKTQSNIISRCNDGRCRTCKFIAHGTSSYTFYNTGEQRKIPHSLSCSSDNLIYLINCKRCIKKDPTLPCQYIGQTSRTLRERFGEHRRGIQNNTDESVPIHFNQPKHTLNDVQLIPILHINNNRDSIRLSMEQHLIEKAGTLQNGINRTCDH